MKTSNSLTACVFSDPKTRPCLCSLFVIASLTCAVYFLGSAFLAKDFSVLPRLEIKLNNTRQTTHLNKCEKRCRLFGSETLPDGIVVKTSNLEMRPLWGSISAVEQKKSKQPVNLLAVAVGIKQKKLVDKLVKKFLENHFVVMLFHYDGAVDEWNDLQWNSHVIHVSAMNQTKWWFAKRFLHPDIVAEYDYIFLWDEDLGIDNFHPGRYISIVKVEGLEISQPALDPTKSEVHHPITSRRRNSRVHRRFYKLKGSGRCNDSSTAPPCVGWVEMMAPVFSRAAWQCAWYMIQNDLIHAWGLDMQLGYCAQGDRTKNVGVVDSEYVVHLGLPTLGGSEEATVNDKARDSQALNSHAVATSVVHKFDNRSAVRRQSYIEMKIFKSRWEDAVNKDKCWVDPY